jgi:hypothetical protein
MPAKKVKRETKPSLSPSPSTPTKPLDDETYARQLQAEFNSHDGPRASRTAASGSTIKKKRKAVVKKKRSGDSGDEGEGGDGSPKKKRKVNENSAFNKELILRWVSRIAA